ncbi:MAG: hypothetical protein JNJ48_02010, partial [Phycisphaerae bacterium]|nr:hypothetical protein [Phycisphaerae bacterium]
MIQRVGHVISCGLAGVVLSAGVSFAAEPPPAAPAGKAPPLSGPQVPQRDVPGVQGQFGEGRERGRFVQEIPHRVFMKAINDMIGDGATGDAKASPEVMDKIREIDRAYNEELRKFQAENRDAMNELRPDAPGKGARRPKGPESPDEAMSPDDAKQREAMMERARQLRERMPKAGDAHTKIWTLLTEPQRAAVQVELDKFTAEQEKRRGEMYVRQRLQQQGKSPAGSPDAAAPKRPAEPGAAGGLSPERRERLMKLFSQLTPEQQEEVLRRLEERLGQSAGKPQGPAG